MSDPRNVAHGKKVAQEKHHEQPKSGGGGKRRSRKGNESTATPNQSSETSAPEIAKPAPAELEKSVTVLSKPRDMEFQSRANIEALAALSLSIEDELKQKTYDELMGPLYSA